MLDNGAFPWKNWATGETVNETTFQNIYDSIHNADKKPFWMKTWENYIWYRNTKDLHTMSAWSGAIGTTTVASDNSSAMTNDLAIKAIVNGTGGNYWCGFYNDPWSTQNMLKLNDGIELTNDKISVVFNFYIDDITKWQGVSFRFGNDGSNFYSCWISSSSLITGWNQRIVNLTSFSTTGTVNWNSIDYFYCYAYGINSNINGAFWIMDQITLVRLDQNTYPHAFQVGDGQTSETWSSLIPSLSYFHMFTNEYHANHELGVIRTNSGTNTRWLPLDGNTYKEFYAKTWMRCKSAGISNSICFYVDSLNYIETYISADVFYLKITIGGATTTKSIALDATLTKNYDFGINLYKIGTTIIAETQGEHVKPKVLTGYYPSTEEGTVNFGSPVANSISFIRDWVISHKSTDLCRLGAVNIL